MIDNIKTLLVAMEAKMPTAEAVLQLKRAQRLLEVAV